MQPLPETDEALNEYLEVDDGDLRAALIDMASHARAIVPSCVGLSLGLIHDDLTFTLVATAEEVAMIDASQYLAGGPCVDVAEGSEPLDLDIADVLDEERWSAFARASAARGVASSLSLPLTSKGELIGGINLYAARAGAFHGKHEELAAALGTTAAGAVTDADLEFRTRLMSARAPRTLADIRQVDVAVGLLASQLHVDVDAAREHLDDLARRAGVSVIKIASIVLETYWDE